MERLHYLPTICILISVGNILFNVIMTGYSNKVEKLCLFLSRMECVPPAIHMVCALGVTFTGY